MLKIDTNKDKIANLLTRGVEDVLVYESIFSKLESGKQLRVKFGIDPTGPNIHIGRAVVLHKLKAFQDLGHQIVLIIGDFTAQIGDASDKTEKRPMLDRETIKENFKAYSEQIGKILDMSQVELTYNSDWLSQLGFQEISELAECFTVQQMSARRNFKDRLEAGNEVSLREFLYPLMQGYDSVAIRADIEIGGFDQLFNLKAGRILQKHFGQPEQDILTTTMLEGTDGRKMSTSWGNVVTIVDAPEDIFGKLMTTRDELIIKYFTLTTTLSLEEIGLFEMQLKDQNTNPRDIKMRLAYEVVKLYHGEEKAKNAQADFVSKFQKKEIPEDIETYTVNHAHLADLLVNKGVVTSKSEFRRLLEMNAITHLESNNKITQVDEFISGTYRIGSHRFVKLDIEN